jgi:formylglycine-generating enzyme required for sulfatase activity
VAFDVFISYPHQNKAVADAACATLEVKGVRCWIAPRDIAPSAEWAASIVEAIDQCRVMVLIFSAHANESKQIHREVQQAFDGEKPVIPFRIENIHPEQSLRYYMGSVHWLDALTPPLGAHLEKLVLAVQALLSATATEAVFRDASRDDAKRASYQPPNRKAFAWRAALGACGIVAVAAAASIGFWFANSSPPKSELTALMAAAHQGDPAAENTLGIKYAAGEDGLPRDDEKAVTLYREAAAQGFAKAQSNLGDMYFFGRGGLERDYAQARALYSKAAEQGLAAAQYRLGFMYYSGYGVDRDYREAFGWYAKAADQKYSDAQFRLGSMYETGQGTEPNIEKAIEYYKRAALDGSIGAQQALDRLHAAGPTVPHPTAAKPAVSASPAITVFALSPEQERALKPKATFRECDRCPEMIVVPSGNFTMGSPNGEKGRDDDEGPRRKVTFANAFAVGTFAVTFEEWDACVADGGCNGNKPDDEGWGRGLRPVINVSWDDASAYVKWLSNKAGKPYRLLSEAEREYVARAGTITAFWWGNSISTNQANYNGTAYAGASEGYDRKRTVDVNSFEPNPWGLYQVHGNIDEWTEDCYHDSYNRAPLDGSPWTTGDCDAHVIRGGSWRDDPKDLRSAARAVFQAPPARSSYRARRGGFVLSGLLLQFQFPSLFPFGIGGRPERSNAVGLRVARTLLLP